MLWKSLNQISASQIFVFDFYIGETFMKYYGDTALASVSCLAHKISLSNWADWNNGQKKPMGLHMKIKANGNKQSSLTNCNRYLIIIWEMYFCTLLQPCCPLNYWILSKEHDTWNALDWKITHFSSIHLVSVRLAMRVVIKNLSSAFKQQMK